MTCLLGPLTPVAPCWTPGWLAGWWHRTSPGTVPPRHVQTASRGWQHPTGLLADNPAAAGWIIGPHCSWCLQHMRTVWPLKYAHMFSLNLALHHIHEQPAVHVPTVTMRLPYQSSVAVLSWPKLVVAFLEWGRFRFWPVCKQSISYILSLRQTETPNSLEINSLDISTQCKAFDNRNQVGKTLVGVHKFPPSNWQEVSSPSGIY